MSLAGALQFERNLRKVMATEAFKKANDGEKLKMGGRLLQSKYGGVLGTKVRELKQNDR